MKQNGRIFIKNQRSRVKLEYLVNNTHLIIKALCDELQSFVRTMAIQEKEPPLVDVVPIAGCEECEVSRRDNIRTVLSHLHNFRAKKGPPHCLSNLL
jgi:hypothetical protein